MAQPNSFIAVDIGNSRIKLGLFETTASAQLPEPVSCLTLDPEWRAPEIDAWLPPQAAQATWHIASVNRPATAQLLAYLDGRGINMAHQLTAADLPLRLALEQPETVGIDRLLAAVAANALRAPQRAAIIVDLGTAITVDLISAEGVFCGGAILPGIAMSARALDEFTDLVPLVPVSELAEPPPAVGNSTIAAVRSGLYWGAVGAVRELVRQLDRETSGAELFLTGGTSPVVAELLLDRAGAAARWVPHLTLAGIALSLRAGTSSC